MAGLPPWWRHVLVAAVLSRPQPHPSPLCPLQILFVINKPDVYKSPSSDTYVIFGEVRQRLHHVWVFWTCDMLPMPRMLHGLLLCMFDACSCCPPCRRMHKNMLCSSVLSFFGMFLPCLPAGQD